MAVIRSILFSLVFYIGTAIIVLLAFPIAMTGAPTLRRHAVSWARFHRWCAQVLLGIHSRVEGVVPEGAMLFAAKHQSMYETIELLVILDQPAVVMKRELTQIPFWGKIAMLYGAVPVDRAGSTSALRDMLRIARKISAGGRAIVIFPEGTRVPPGRTAPLRPGFAGLYRTLALPVTPIAIDSGRLYPRRTLIKRPGIVTFRFGETIPTGLPRDTIEARVFAAINSLESRPA